MADISVTAANVLPSASAIIRSGIAGATITQGQTLYIDSANNYVLKLADSDGVALVATVAGIAINAASAGQKVSYVVSDSAFVIGATILAGDDVWLSDTPGGITKTRAELEAGDYIVHLGVMTSTTTMNLNITIGGVVAA